MLCLEDGENKMQKKHDLTAIIIAKNEEQRLDRCLSSLKWISHIIVVDNHSTDKTREIAHKHNTAICDSESRSFSVLREIGAKNARSKWILYMDADEVMTDELKNEIIEILNKSDSKPAYFIKRKNYYYGKYLWPETDKMQRLFIKDKLIGWQGDLHETPDIDGETGELDNYLLHYTHRNLEDMIIKTNEWSDIEANLRFISGHPQMTWWRFIRIMLTGFYDSFIHKKGYRAGTVGLIESIYQSFSMFITYAKLWEMQKNNITE